MNAVSKYYRSLSSFRLALCLAILTLAFDPGHGLAQSLIAVTDSMAISCFDDFSDQKTIGLISTDSFPSIRSGLIDGWKELGLAVFDLGMESSSASEMDRLVRYRIESIDVRYQEEGKNLSRDIDLVLYQTSSDNKLRVLSNGRCEKNLRDLVRKDIPRQEPPDFKMSFNRKGKARFIKPALLTGTVAAISYLFFTVRSGE